MANLGRHRPAVHALHENIGQLLGELRAQEETVLICAALLGYRFEKVTLEKALGCDGDTLTAALRHLVESEVIVEDAFERFDFRFSHELVRDVLIDVTPLSAARAYHRAILCALEAHKSASNAELAHHSWEAGVENKTLIYCERAGDEAVAMLASGEAARYYGRALTVARNVDKERLVGKIAGLDAND